MQRRRFLQSVLTTAAGAGAARGQQSATPPTDAGSAAAAGKLPKVQNPGELRGEMLYRPLGRTGEHVSAIGLGGSHVAQPGVTEDETIRLIHEALDRGLNFMDNSWDYNEGASERRMGKALAQSGYRQKAFLMTKIDGRTKQVAEDQLNDSLQRLQTDHIDLIQFHEVLRFDDPDRIFAEGGALEHVMKARQAGKARFIGFTGHKDPHVHLYMLEVAAKHGFHFDTAQMPLNVMDAHFRSFAQLVVPHLVEQGIGVLGMKPFGGGTGIILKSNTVQPLECLLYALNLPTSVVITGINNQRVLDQAFQAAKTFKPMDDEQLQALLSKTEQVARTGQFELFKTTAHFDTTARHADWLGADTPAVQKLAPQLPG
ncbi:MAG TPA: aldo/keto reductase [Bryobacteraceae bacterium]|nr:aldo/keto reductase [Bryobacteraceae bacterium]